MDIDGIIQNIIVFARENIIVTVIVGIFVVFLLFRHPKVLLTVVGLGAIAYGLAWIFEKLRGTGLG